MNHPAAPIATRARPPAHAPIMIPMGGGGRVVVGTGSVVVVAVLSQLIIQLIAADRPTVTYRNTDLLRYAQCKLVGLLCTVVPRYLE